MGAVFISYSRRDSVGALALVSGLGALQIPVWLDQRSIPVSVPWFDEIAKAVRSAPLVVVVRSPHWDASGNCQKEFLFSQSLGKAVLWLDAASDPASWPAQVQGALGALPSEEFVRADLLGAASRWAAAGRPDSHLPEGRALDAYRRLLRWGVRDEIAEAFVRKAHRAYSRRRTVALLSVLLTLGLMVAWGVTKAVSRGLGPAYEAQLKDFGLAREARSYLKSDAYEALTRAKAAVDAHDVSVTQWVLADALAVLLPTRVTNPTGAEPRAAVALPAGPVSDSRGFRAEYLPSESAVVIHRPGHAELRLSAAGAVTALALAPAGDLVAMADARGVVLYESASGEAVATLRGLEGAVDRIDLTDPGKPAAGAGRIEAVWTLPAVSVLASDDSWYVGLAANPERTRFLASARGGTVTLIKGTTSVTHRRIAGADTLGSGAVWIGNTWVAAAYDRNERAFLVQLSADGDELRRVSLPEGCTPPSLVATSPTEVGVPCPSQSLVRLVDLVTGEGRSVGVPVQAVSGIRDVGGALLVWSVHGQGARSEGPGKARLLDGGWVSGCTESTGIVRATDDGRRIVVTGEGVANFCTRIYPNPEDRTEAARLASMDPALRYARGAAWSPDGSTVALAFTSGDLWLFDAETYYTRAIIRVAGSELRGISFLPDGKTVLAVTRDGRVLLVDVSLAVAASAERLAEAERRLKIGVQGGLARR